MENVNVNKKSIITFGGKPGSGKSTTARLVAEMLGFERYSTGDFFRELSNQKGLDLLAGNHHAEKDRSIDDQVDQRQRDLGEQSDKFVIDGRLAWLFIPQSFKVYLDLDSVVAAERIIAHASEERSQKEVIHEDPKEYAASLDLRLASEGRRYASLYGVDPSELKNYDLVIDTAAHTSEEVAGMVVDGFNKWLAQN